MNKIVGRRVTRKHPCTGWSVSLKVIGNDVWHGRQIEIFLLHIAYGICDKSGFGGMEITDYNSKTGDFDSYNFNQMVGFRWVPLLLKTIFGYGTVKK